jgi:hypothetical protein
MNAGTLRIAHVPDSNPPRFRVLRASDLKEAEAVELTPPVEVSVEGREEGLPRQLQWYLEEFLSYPFSPRTEQAERVLNALRGWGRDTFTLLFGSGRAGARLLSRRHA